ncbi:glycoside hydrolase family 15 protein [Mesorhizobium sp. ES1-3]|uniref:glycoside hydrolase family 15 protein n=1 Tax=Mesorhizobium sp. ES1-3 TaxID=2876628 RepID=UPI001CD0222B|nr:glycoside hydrolase family 15 protein [Mesorhizobium sp. ES1-3]MBZ9673655.1 glycoside hydrolase family 15 protein [Mesorhizobium sp. ES1-3]
MDKATDDLQRDGFPPIEDYAIIGDCRAAALVSRSGAIEWACLPNIDSPSIFAALLDRERGGHFSVRPTRCVNVSRRYLKDTNVLETTFECRDGTLKVTDFFAVGPEGLGRLEPERELIRIIDCIGGNPEMEIAVALRPDYGRGRVSIESRDAGTWAVAARGMCFFLQSEVPFENDGQECLVTAFRLRKGDRRRLILSVASRGPAILPAFGECDPKLDQTVGWWRDWIEDCNYCGPHTDLVRRSMLVLKLLQFSLSGAVVAAPTTSLPERIGGNLNWDYRFCWLRDASFTLRAFLDAGFNTEGMVFFNWMMNATRRTQPELKTLYDVFGRTNAKEHELGHLSGYMNSSPVRIGNAAQDQLQLDVYGAVVGAAADSIDRGNSFSPREMRLLFNIGKLVSGIWHEPDNGIWETRGNRNHHVYSKVMCWSVLNDLVNLCDQGTLKVARDDIAKLRERIRREILERGFNRDLNSFVGAYGETYVDATALLLPRSNFIDANDPRMNGTWKRIDRMLSAGPWLYRHQYGPSDKAVRDEPREGAFGICSFWAVDYLVRAGRIDEAQNRFNALAACANDVGLFSEEFDPRTGQFLGNMPQAFTHTGLVNAALAIRNFHESGRADAAKTSDAQAAKKRTKG